MTKETLSSELELSLRRLLRGVKFDVDSLPTEFDPLFLLVTMRPHVIGFAVLASSPADEYHFAYDKLKQLYSSKAKEWAGLDVDLVLCNESKNGEYHELFNSIELDPYFCRKYVIDTRKGVQASLGRLPFIPLNADVVETTTGREMQVSCQTYLMRNGVSANLARYITVPYSRSEQGIVDECLAGNLGAPVWQKQKLEEPVSIAKDSRQAVRLRKLEITGFRAYKAFQEFDLDADLIVFYGPNGYGKTSFYDAVDFAATGSIHRFDLRYQRKGKDLAKVLRNLDSEASQSKVRLLATVDDAEIDVVREVGSTRAEALLDGETANRTEVLLRLCGLDKGPDLRIENLVRLFRATHLFGQDSQALTHMMSESMLPDDTVTRMLALQDYVEAINKSNRVSAHIANLTVEKSNLIDQLNASIESKRKEFETLQKVSQAAEKRTIAVDLVDTMKERIEKALDVQLPPVMEPTVDTIQKWRIHIVSEIGSLTERAKIGEEIATQIQLVNEGQQKFVEDNKMLNEQEKTLQLLNQCILRQHQLLIKYEEEIRAAVTATEAAAARSKILVWLVESRPRMHDIRNRLSEVARRSRATATKLSDCKAQREEESQKIENVEKRIESIRTRIKAADGRRDMLLDFEGRLSKWKRLVADGEKLKLALEDLKENYTDLREEIQLKKKELGVESLNVQESGRKLKALQSAQSQLTSLLDQLESHITTGQCPLCGTVHRSVSELREKLKKQKGHQSKELKETLSSYENTRKLVDKLTEQLHRLEDRLTQTEENIKSLRTETEENRKQTEWYIEVSEGLEISLETKNLEEVLDSKKNEIVALIEKEKENLVEKREELKRERSLFEELATQEASLEKELSRIKSQKKKLDMQEQQFVEEALSRNVAIDLSNDKIEENLKELGLQQENLGKKIASLEGTAAKTRNEINELEPNKRITEKEVSRLQKETQNLRTLREEVASKVRALQLSDDITANQAREFVRGISDRIALLESIQSDVLNLAIAIDSSQRAAVLARLENEIAGEEKNLREIEPSLAQLKRWDSYFGRISSESSSIQNEALSKYIEYYGPLASTVQKRLRPFYGYGDIRLGTSKGGIQVFIDRGQDKDLSPSDYLSQSQMQIIMLSLFLSATLTQNWSTFCPILLDDPVTHFDDLNSYSLMDLITGLVNRSDATHQIILSTCEDRLFRLMKQKFDRLEKKVLYHVFESFGDSGPIVATKTN